MIAPTSEMRLAFDRVPGAQPGCVCAVCLNHRLAAVLAIVEREHAILPRGAQALCCSTHPEIVLRWGSCHLCASQAYEGDEDQAEPDSSPNVVEGGTNDELDFRNNTDPHAGYLDEPDTAAEPVKDGA